LKKYVTIVNYNKKLANSWAYNSLVLFFDDDYCDKKVKKKENTNKKKKQHDKPYN